MNKQQRDYAIDRIKLGKYKDGAEPIRAMKSYAPKAPKGR